MFSPNAIAELIPSPSPPEAHVLNRRAIERFVRRDLEGALADFRQAVQNDPSYAEAWNNSGLVRQLLGRLGEAVADFDRAVSLRPDYPEALNNRGRARLALGDAAGAMADFDRALTGAAGRFRASVLHNRGALKQGAGDLAGALADFDRALAIDPDHIVTYLNRGSARQESGDLEGALADFERALARLPPERAATAYHKRGGVRVLRNDFAGAIADYDRALALEPRNVCFYVSRGNARYHRRDPRAIADYQIAFRIDAEATAREIVRILAGDVRRGAEDVLDNCARHLRISGRDVLAHARCGLTLVLLGREAEAAPHLAHFQEAVPDDGAYFSRLLALVRGIRV
ncbi:MAG TPA: tetratricopeptide repeat protein [Gemmataceae bacterium]|nr:tetratricopeptide repeat protein [Gemmataceae bacterium]